MEGIIGKRIVNLITTLVLCGFEMGVELVSVPKFSQRIRRCYSKINLYCVTTLITAAKETKEGTARL